MQECIQHCVNDENGPSPISPDQTGEPNEEAPHPDSVEGVRSSHFLVSQWLTLKLKPQRDVINGVPSVKREREKKYFKVVRVHATITH